MMYSTFRTAWISFRNRDLMANFEGSIPEYPPDWWGAKPIQKRLPHLRFTYNHKAPLLDNINTGHLELYSARLIDIFASAGVLFETFPATIIDRRTGAVLSETHRLFHLLEMHPGLDRKKTFVNKPVISAKRMQVPLPLFRDQEFKHFVLIHRDLRAILEEQNITGCAYKPVEDYS
jgi:hypothetical protein